MLAAIEAALLALVRLLPARQSAPFAQRLSVRRPRAALKDQQVQVV